MVDTREVAVCSLCGEDIVPDLTKGDRQGQPIEIRFAAYTQRMNLCEKDIKIVGALRHIGERVYPGCLSAMDALPYLPRGDDSVDD